MCVYVQLYNRTIVAVEASVEAAEALVVVTVFSSLIQIRPDVPFRILSTVAATWRVKCHGGPSTASAAGEATAAPVIYCLL